MTALPTRSSTGLTGVLSVLLLLGALGSGCVGTSKPASDTTETTTAAATPTPPAPPKRPDPADRPPPVAPKTPPKMIPGSAPAMIGRQAPSRTLPLLNGGSSSLEEHRGEVVMVTFWASWCGPCRKEIPELNEIYAELKDEGLKVIGVNVDKNPASARRWAQSNPIEFPVLLDSKAELMGEYHVAFMPTLFVIDREGVVRKLQRGYRKTYLDDTMKVVRSLL
ncbi:MAG: TlpA disulfide reductase family protein [Acidobacteriota bacterium]